MSVQLHFLDTSALTDLLDPDLAHVRHRLVGLTTARHIAVLVTDPLTWELFGTRGVNDAKYRAMVDLLLRLSRGRVLRNAHDRRERELRAGRRLTLPELVDDERVFRPVFDADVVDHEAARRTGYALGLRFGEAEKAAATVEALDDEERRQRAEAGESPGGSGAGWRQRLKEAHRSEKFALTYAADIARDDMEKVADPLGVDASGLDPRELPTFWWSALIHTARIRAVVVAGTSPLGRRSANQLDLLHLKEAAAYADVFVCSDAPARSFAQTVPQLRCEVLSFDAWASRLGE